MGKTQQLIEQLVKKYESLGENPNTYLEGLLHAKPINYWDYIEVENLLSLQKPRTNYQDELVFIGYHQITELVLKLMIHELKQLMENEVFDEAIFTDKIHRLTRYTDMLITSFTVMKDGMSYDDYNIFRMTLAPASGFQSAQFRFFEIYCTELTNLINEEGKSRLPKSPKIEDYFEHIYWKDAGHNRKTGKKTLTLVEFEKKYLGDFIELSKQVKGKTINEQFLNIENPSKALLKAMRDFDYNYNVSWPLTHLRTAQKYLNKKGENKAATGGSKWQKYLHPRHQQRMFFPSLWKDVNILEWKNENV